MLEDLFVAPEARGKGAADALIEAVAERARRHGAPVVTWLTAPDNHRAQAVYNRVGGTSEHVPRVRAGARRLAQQLRLLCVELVVGEQALLV